MLFHGHSRLNSRLFHEPRCNWSASESQTQQSAENFQSAADSGAVNFGASYIGGNTGNASVNQTQASQVSGQAVQRGGRVTHTAAGAAPTVSGGTPATSVSSPTGTAGNSGVQNQQVTATDAGIALAPGASAQDIVGAGGVVLGQGTTVVGSGGTMLGAGANVVGQGGVLLGTGASLQTGGTSVGTYAVNTTTNNTTTEPTEAVAALNAALELGQQAEMESESVALGAQNASLGIGTNIPAVTVNSSVSPSSTTGTSSNTRYFVEFGLVIAGVLGLVYFWKQKAA